MPNRGHFWSDEETRSLLNAYADKPVSVPDADFVQQYSVRVGKSYGAVKGKIIALKQSGKISRVMKESSYPVYDKPLVMEGDALVITDLELPFHHADFINRVLEIADAWKITQLILGGDALHLDSFSGWEPNWKAGSNNNLSENSEQKLIDFARGLSKSKQAEFFALWGEIGERVEQDGASTELDAARRELNRLGEQFANIDFVLGNHEGRFLRAIQTAVDPKELTRLLELGGRWRIAPYYYSILISGGEKFQIEHPKNTAKASAWKLASKYGCHVIMGHNHHVVFQFDLSGKYYAIETGHGVDESRLPYAAQRHNVAHAHALGACIVRGGVPWLLHARTDWKAMKKL